jgi:hypothetical protein
MGVNKINVPIRMPAITMLLLLLVAVVDVP